MKFFTAAQMRMAEEEAAKIGLNPIRLMENAGSAAARLIRERFPSGKKCAVVCGKGNNGGDGFVVARKLFEQNWNDVTVVLGAGGSVTKEAGEMLARIRSLGLHIVDYTTDAYETMRVIGEAELIVETLFGTGFRGPLDERTEDLIACMNDSKAFRVALDMPAGADCDTGETESLCLRADLTVAFTALKPGHAVFPAAEFCGETVAADIGIPDTILDEIPSRLHAVDENAVRNVLRPRRKNTHKGDFGRVLLVCGSKRMPGACALAAEAALRCGAGLAEAALPESALPAVAARLAEPIFLPLPEDADGFASSSAAKVLGPSLKAADAVLVGCGLGNTPHTRHLVRYIAETARSPLVLDADGINVLAEDINILKKAGAPVVLTPHPGEMARLLGVSAAEVNRSRLECARDFATARGAVTVLKGAHTIVALPDGTVFINMTGNAGLSTGGSGDVLAGMIASFLAQGLPPSKAACAAVHFHGAAADRCAKRLSQAAMLPSDVIGALPDVFLAYGKRY